LLEKEGMALDREWLQLVVVKFCLTEGLKAGKDSQLKFR
tara:strand:- start:188 stop:304 length:117 start_codon:yes stop_codon:yes gene_type:complete